MHSLANNSQVLQVLSEDALYCRTVECCKSREGTNEFGARERRTRSTHTLCWWEGVLIEHIQIARLQAQLARKDYIIDQLRSGVGEIAAEAASSSASSSVRRSWVADEDAPAYVRVMIFYSF